MGDVPERYGTRVSRAVSRDLMDPKRMEQNQGLGTDGKFDLKTDPHRRQTYRTRIQITEEEKKAVEKNAARAYSSINSFIKKLALEEVERRAPNLPNVNDEILLLIPKERPDALVYTAPILGTKIITSPNDDGWKGVAFDPDLKGSLFAWTSDDLNLPIWARNKKIIKAMLFIASRIDDENLSHFRVPDSKVIVSAQWQNDRWERGWVSDDKQRQEWERGGWYAHMPPGPFNLSVELRRLMNMLARTMTVKNDGLTTKMPLS